MTARERERVLDTPGDPEPVSRPVQPSSGRVRFSGDTRKDRRSRAPSTEWRVPLDEPTLYAPVPRGISIAPPPVRFGPAPVPAAPPYPRRRAGLGWLVKAGLSVAAIVLAWQVGLPWVQGLIAEHTADSAGQTTTAPPCPSEAAVALPGQSGTLLARYHTTKHVITVCQTSDGQVFYDGQVRGQPPGPQTHITLPAQATADGYIAHNGNYTYQITGGRIVVTNGGSVLLDEVLQPA